MLHFFFKAMHIIGAVAWFAGLFYLVRMFVYYAEAADKPEPERGILQKQFLLMQWRVYKIICNPAMMITFIFGFAMLFYNPAFLEMPWLHVKLLLVFLLLGYHLYCKYIIKNFESGEINFSSTQFRLLNEVPTLFLVSIVLLAVYKNTLNFLYAFFGVLLFGVLLVVGVRVYKKVRERGA